MHDRRADCLAAHTALEGSIFAFLAPADAPCPDLLSTTFETFKSRDQCLPAAKVVSSAAHVNGRKLVIGDFADYYQTRAGLPTTREQLRCAIGWLHVLGVNALHNLSQWRQREPSDWKHLTAYAGRLGYTLSDGVHVADVALLYPITTVWAHYVPSTGFLMLPPIGSLERPKIWSETYAAEASAWDVAFRRVVWELLERQRDFDIVDDAAVARSTLADGRLHLADEAYRVLILPPMDVLDEETLAKAEAFARHGGVVIGFHPLPAKSAQRGDDSELRRVTLALFGREIPLAGEYVTREVGAGQAVVVADEAGLMRALHAFAPPDIAIEPQTRTLFGLHRRKDGQDIYFLANNSPQRFEGSVTLRVQGRPEIWNPLDGTVSAPGAWEAVDGTTRLAISIEGCAGQVIVVEA